MRNLTVKREKSYVGCLAKIKLYVPDEASGELTVMGVPCRLLGELKNGEEKTFPIGNGATEVYAIADKLSKDYCNDVYRIPGGKKDLRISGRCRFSLGSNAFVFAGQDTPEKQQERKKRSRKSLWMFLACAALGILLGGLISWAMLGGGEPAPRVFAVEEMRITLTEEFQSFENNRFTSSLVSADVGITVLKEPFLQVPGSETLSLEEYGHLVIANNGITGTMLCTENGLTFFEFDRENTEIGQVFSYFAAVYKSGDAFWLVQMYLPKAEYSALRPTLETYARSVRFE